MLGTSEYTSLFLLNIHIYKHASSCVTNKKCHMEETKKKTILNKSLIYLLRAYKTDSFCEYMYVYSSERV